MTPGLAESIAVQRQMVADMNLFVHDDRLLTDVVMRDRATGEWLDRSQVFDRHAMMLTVLAERGAL